MDRDLLATIDIIVRLAWRPARTMPQIPHEYTVREEARDEADYWVLHQVIARHGMIERWHGGKVYGGASIIRRGRGRPGLYLYPGDGWRYWYMSRSPISRIINRNRIEEAERLRRAGLIS